MAFLKNSGAQRWTYFVFFAALSGLVTVAEYFMAVSGEQRGEVRLHLPFSSAYEVWGKAGVIATGSVLAGLFCIGAVYRYFNPPTKYSGKL